MAINSNAKKKKNYVTRLNFLRSNCSLYIKSSSDNVNIYKSFQFFTDVLKT